MFPKFDDLIIMPHFSIRFQNDIISKLVRHLQFFSWDFFCKSMKKTGACTIKLYTAVIFAVIK